MDYYRILNVNRDATQAEIKKAYRRLSRKYHPDNAGEETIEQFEKIQEAYAILGNEEKRALYDRQPRSDAGEKDRHPRKQDMKAERQPEQYSDLSAFFKGRYQDRFDKFFGINPDHKNEKAADAKHIDTDRLFKSYFKYK